MTQVPALFPEASPAALTDATSGADDDHEPPKEDTDNAVNAAAQTEVLPEMLPTTGSGVTATLTVEIAVPHIFVTE